MIPATPLGAFPYIFTLPLLLSTHHPYTSVGTFLACMCIDRNAATAFSRWSSRHEIEKSESEKVGGYGPSEVRQYREKYREATIKASRSKKTDEENK
jgi:hypothetical protein